jgi:protein-disulfide isomerase
VDTGVVRLVWRDFPCGDAQSVRAAVAARAAGMQGKFWAYHDYLFAHQFPDEHSGLVTDAYLRAVARRVGLNMALLNHDFADPALPRAVQADKSFGEQLGVPGTPAFLIGGRPFFGPGLAGFCAGPILGRSSPWRPRPGSLRAVRRCWRSMRLG